ncbi:acetamidase/formamidase family protein [Anaeromyxobacter oryzae]|uniref:Amidase n=1 Tax=Anaeromyxobacter oryzae TaxID=2918170 RepID=A0ABM7WSM5_9BACT|nr:acetamidase/formamidase family protein [Anaeromyxobacter oryzae]BDG02490.1 amidase [Anaeromyxobacter oryzae]
MATHHLTEKAQGKFHYTIGPYAEPVLRVRPGDTVVVETADAFEGRITDERVKPSSVLEVPFLNPQSGPIYVEGAEKGDALAVHIDSILPRKDRPGGTTCLIPNFGGLCGTDLTALLHEPLPEKVWKMEVTEAGVRWNGMTFPYTPFLGTISTSPQIDSINALTGGKHGGNMDLPDVCPGATIYLPVKVPGALLYLGDGHATQGDGELCGVAVEFATITTLTVNVVKGWDLQWPRVENDRFIMSVGSARPMEDAARIAYADLVKWLESKFGFDRWDAYFVLSEVGKVRLANMVDPMYTIGASISKEYLKQR